jgi:2-oxoglutarate/2-oxoacid ferredoxin oxidoreductase subunit beta
MNGATFIARGFSGDPKHLAELMKKAILHKGFALIDIFSPCVTFNHDNDYNFFRPRLKRLEDEGHDPSDWKAACEKAMAWGDKIYIGLFLQREAPSLDQLEPVLDEGGPLVHRPLGLSREQGQRIIKRMM